MILHSKCYLHVKLISQFRCHKYNPDPNEKAIDIYLKLNYRLTPLGVYKENKYVSRVVMISK